MDAVIEGDADVLYATVSLDRVLFAVDPAKRLRLIILDACRANPFASRMKRSVASRSVSRGLAKVEPTSPNTLVAYAAKAGSTAADGDSGNSPFAAALVKYLSRPGLDVRRAFGFVRDDVLKITGNRQERGQAPIGAKPGNAKQGSGPVAHLASLNGKWNTVAGCPRDGAADGYVWRFVATLKDGQFQAQYGTPGAFPSATYEGTINGDGSGTLHVVGFGGNPKFNLTNVAAGTPITHEIAVRFEDSRGTGDQSGRPCHYTFDRQQPSR
ncbi:hypothetical protein CQ13_37985 [Bradyrhizobium retamae]|uniref:Peptidase C14 caspase domain-containing protein n=1 Tax=Bradyrhizobium retamae TaxID=1300035 RepID=A0A0R3NBX7_9BRAD|nr:hypothetical protein CQ13_37985 [Bradyrhizobium retamae]